MIEAEYAKIPAITLIGAGFSALATATQLLARGASVRVIGPETHFGRGVAYGAARPEHLLNVPAERMGIEADAPGAFADALGLQGDARRAFLPRARYGEFLADRWRQLADAHPDRLQLLRDAVSGLRMDTGGWRIRTTDGREWPARELVLALGNAGVALAQDAPGRIADPWQAGALERIAPQQAVLILGTGLTMIDIASTLLLRGHRGPILALSRRGLLPRVHPQPPLAPQPPSPALLDALASQRLAAAVRAFRQACDAGASPDALADGLRPQIADIWRAWTPATRARFLRHLRPWWDRVRHRVPAEVMQRLLDAMQAGRLDVRAGRLLDGGGMPADDGENGVAHARIQPRGRGDVDCVAADWRIDATGWDGPGARLAAHPVLRGLIETGLALPDPLGLGLACSREGQVIGVTGPTPHLHLIGNLRRGECWESSAVPELRMQAAALAERLAPA